MHDLSFFENIKLYVGFTAASSAALRELHPIAQPFFGPIVDDFYAAIEAHPGARQAITGGQAQIDRLKQTLLLWMEKMLLGPHDEAYYELRARIGRMHVRIALPQQYMFTAMDRIRVRLLDVVRSQIVGDAARVERTATALNQIMDLELAIMLDTYREDLETKHRNAERLATIESVPAFVLAMDEAGRVTIWNSELERVTGYQRAEMLGGDGRRFVEPNGRPLDLPLKTGGKRKVRWRQAKGKGHDAHTTTYAVGIDVTDEDEILRRLLRSERLAAVGTLAAGLAHEVRNPLNSASLQLTLLERRLDRGDEPTAVLAIAHIIKSEIDRLDRLVREFLAFAQPRQLEPRPVAVSELFDAVAGLIAPEAEAVHVTTAVDVAPGTPPIRGEEERLRQVLLNLTRNAVEAMSEKGGRLRLLARRADNDVEITVEDDGPGFGEDLPVFDAFFTTKSQGTGLGLAIVHRIVTDHGGTIRVESHPGMTRFTLALPAAPAT